MSGTFSLRNGNTIASGGSTKEEFSFSATDSGSGVSKIEYKKPSSSSWSSYAAGTIIQPVAEQGLYFFRAIDKSGNASTYTITTLHPCADGHNYVAKVIEPTCTEKGYTAYACSVCGDSYTEWLRLLSQPVLKKDIQSIPARNAATVIEITKRHLSVITM